LIQKYNTQRISSSKKKKISKYSCIQKDEMTVIKVESEHIWIWGVVIIELESKEILGMSISKERNMFVTHECFLLDVVDEYDQHPISTDGSN
jgi:putative transposase